MTLDIVCVTPSSSGGWGPVTNMAGLAGTVFGTEPQFIYPVRAYGRLRKATSLIPQRRSGDRALLLIASHPGDLLMLARLGMVLGQYSRVGAWIFDSFWADRIPLFARRKPRIDHVWVTDREFVDQYRDAMGVPVSWLPWGTDALASWKGRHDATRSVDVLRLGRQPHAWDDDHANERVLRQRSLTYAGRFPDITDGDTNQQHVRTLLNDSKVVLASGNRASPGPYTHPSAEYISGRFTDALAAGTVIAGQRPRCAAADLFPEEAWVNMSVGSREDALDVLQESVQRYSPARAVRLRKHALAEFDWRHRLRDIATVFDVASPVLDSELAAVKATVNIS